MGKAKGRSSSPKVPWSLARLKAVSKEREALRRERRQLVKEKKQLVKEVKPANGNVQPVKITGSKGKNVVSNGRLEKIKKGKKGDETPPPPQPATKERRGQKQKA